MFWMKKGISQIVVVFLCAVIPAISSAAENCEFSFSTCPESFNNDTIYVPPSVIALSNRIFTCNPSNIIEGLIDTSAPPSIMFVIDHSYSMMGLGNTWPGNDVSGSRFNVVRDLIDTIYNIHPDAEVGLVVFREVLYLDHSNEQLFVPLPGYGDQSYLPLLTLDSKIGSSTGMAQIKRILETETVTRHNNTFNRDVICTDMKYKPTFATKGNTNINNAFAAAIEAMKTAKNPKERQFVIFLSDGEPYPPNDPSQHGGKNPSYFSEGISTPTTFTVYFDNDGTTPPSVLTTMTNNIRANGYSSSNPSSNIWVLKTNYDDLMSLLMNSILKQILTVTNGTAKSITINSLVSTNRPDSAFAFADQFALKGTTTPFHITINYQMTNTRTGVKYDTTTITDFVVVRSDHAISPEIATSCWEKPTISLYYEGTKISAVNESMANLEARFGPTSPEYEAVNVIITHANGNPRDQEQLSLTLNTSYWTKTFAREINTPVNNDKKLQHAINDSIVVIYRNPKLPLDTVRLSVPFVPTGALSFFQSSFFDTNADGFIDSITLTGEDISTEGIDLEQLKSLIQLPSYRNLQINSIKTINNGVALIVRENRSGDPNTSIEPNDVVTIKTGVIPGGGYVSGTTIIPLDKMAPVIVNARLIPGEDGNDSLLVNFSENISPVASTQPFRFEKPQGKEYQVIVASNGTLNLKTYNVKVQSVKDSTGIQSQDSVWINTVALISDKSGNVQNNPENRHVSLSIKSEFKLIPSAHNNPFTPGKVEIPAIVAKTYQNNNASPPSDGLVLILKPEGRVQNGVRLYGTVSIFDVAKNSIIENEPMYFDSDSKNLFMVWDGRNKNSRNVATGTYLAVMKVKDGQGWKESQILRIGVKR